VLRMIIELKTNFYRCPNKKLRKFQIKWSGRAAPRKKNLLTGEISQKRKEESEMSVLNKRHMETSQEPSPDFDFPKL